MSRKITGIASIFILLFLTLPVSGQTSPWSEVAPGVWKMSVGTPEKLDLFRAAEIKPALNALSKLGPAPFPLPPDRITAKTGNGTTSLSFPLEKEEKIFGFGLNFKTIYQRGRILQLHVDHYGGTDNGRTHAPVPFYVSDMGYGVFINSSRYLTVYAGTGVRKDSRDAPEERDRNTDR